MGRLPRWVAEERGLLDEIEKLVKERRKFVAFCEELIARDLGIQWGINTRVTDILRDEGLLPLYRKAGLIHVSLGTEAVAQLKLDLLNKETTVAQNKKAVKLLRDAGIVVERSSRKRPDMQKIDWRPRHDKRITGEEQAQIMA